MDKKSDAVYRLFLSIFVHHLQSSVVLRYFSFRSKRFLASLWRTTSLLPTVWWHRLTRLAFIRQNRSLSAMEYHSAC